jgi:bisphosphoglycerate-dependent phosphoglycerate mutase
MHVVHALGIMLKNEKNVLPVAEDNVLREVMLIEGSSMFSEQTVRICHAQPILYFKKESYHE